MNESRARYISLTVIALGAIVLFIPLWMALDSNMTGGSNMRMLAIEGYKPPIEWIVFLSIFLCIGTFIILSAFFKLSFHILSVMEVALMAFLVVSASFNPMAILLCLIALAPQIFYYAVRIAQSSKKASI